MTGGGSAFWLLAYGIFYWASRLSLDSFSGVVLYLGYLFLLAILDFLVTGSFALSLAQFFLGVADECGWLLVVVVQVRLDFWRRIGR